eukprot:570986-Pelagomonas_calceolata.AAC.2
MQGLIICRATWRTEHKGGGHNRKYLNLLIILYQRCWSLQRKIPALNDEAKAMPQPVACTQHAAQ